MDRKLIISTLLLLIVQIFLLAADVDMYFFASSGENESSASEKIGSIINKKQIVKRRSQGSIVWEDSQESDSLMTNDSVLTLENSSAQLTLKEDVKINLSENTLIVLEPAEDEKNDSLRIRFNYGNFLSQNRRQRLQVGSGEFLIDAKPGTHLNLKSLENENIEIEVGNGAVNVYKKNSREMLKTIETGTRITINKTEITREEKISDTLKFNLRVEERVYAHEFPITFSLRWHGNGEEIRIVGPDKKPVFVNVKNMNESSLQFKQGTYHLNLIGNDQISSEVILRILQAPRIRYTSPLPRERFEIGSNILFSWWPAEGIQSYEVELTNNLGERERLPTQVNIHETTPQVEGTVQMRIWGVDEDGFRVPPFYANPLYIIRDPLAPPELLVPKAPRTPASKPGAQLPPPPKNSFATWKWVHSIFFGEVAMAEEIQPLRKIVFEWQPVSGADFYNIEISSEKDFSKPEILQKVKSNSFEWSNYLKRTYYWRVAGGAHSGRMGLFSEIALVDLSNIDLLKPGEIAPGVKMVASAPPTTVVAPAPPVAVIPPPPPQPPQPPPPPPQPPPPHNQWQHTLNLNLHHLNYSLNGDFSATLEGFANISFSEESRCIFSDQSQLTLAARYASVSWRPEVESQLPFQDDLSTNEYSVGALYQQFKKEISYGLHAASLTTLRRTNLETVKSRESILLGPALSYSAIISKQLSYQSQAAILYGDQIGSAKSENQLNYKINQYTIGGDFDFTIFFGADSLSGFYLKSGLHLGVTF